MKKIFLLIIACSVTLAVSVDVVQSNSDAVQSNPEVLKKKITEMIKDSNALDDFWYGDDGEDCGEPNFSIVKIDLKKQIAYLDIYQGKDIYACFYHYPFSCKMKYSFVKGNLKIPKKVEMLEDCQTF